MTDAPRPFSVVIATGGSRPDGLLRLLRSIAPQADLVADVLVVGPPDRPIDLDPEDPALAPLRPVLTIMQAPRGASRQRNVGLAGARGQYVLFPDDDSWLDDDTLERALRALAEAPEGIVARVLTEEGDEFLSRSPVAATSLTVPLSLRVAATHALVLPRKLLMRVGGFDERIGPGAPSVHHPGRLSPFQGGEDSDLAIRCLRAGARIEFRPDVVVRHPDRHAEDADVVASKAFEYSLGYGWLTRAHRLPLRLVATLIIRAAGGLLLAAVRTPSEVRYRWAVLRGRVLGLALAGRVQPWQPADRHPVQLDRDAAATALHEAVAALARAGVRAWLTDGTLLGCVREGDFIQHDWDVDLAVHAGTPGATMKDALVDIGFRVVSEVGTPEHGHQIRFMRDHVELDIYVFYTDGDSMWHAAWMDGQPIIYRYQPFDLEDHEFLGRTYAVPSPPERYLETKYGPDWRVPRTDWNWAYSPLNGEMPRRNVMWWVRKWVRAWRRSFEREQGWLHR
ncbi:MAG: glycosyltransferase [Nitriliruptorales bacterium]|nr:glycosyltransferase [Nitriliruptorales bacterium]